MKGYKGVLLFAGSRSEYLKWIKEHMPQVPTSWVYVSSYEKSLGYDGVLIFKIGTWYKHKWIKKAIDRLESLGNISTTSPAGEEEQ